MKIKSIRDLSFCFICSRNKRDAALAVVISVGTVILCLAANILFNVSGILQSANRDNVGFTISVFVYDYYSKDEIGQTLDDNGIKYTHGFSKFMNFTDLSGVDYDGNFYALIIASTTDNNPHFSVEEGSFLGDNYFERMCKLKRGHTYDIFGSEVNYLGRLTDNQYLAPVSYAFIINQTDWGLSIDESFFPVYMIDASTDEEMRIKELLAGYDCYIESASELINEIKKAFKQYIDILVVIAGMIFLVTITVFYTIIQTDLNKRKTELYLYRVYGAGVRKAQKVVFNEYLIIALVTSLAVSFTVMVCGELYFYLALGKHYPLSIPIIAATTCFAAAFVFVCCRVAGFINIKMTGLEVIRDE